MITAMSLGVRVYSPHARSASTKAGGGTHKLQSSIKKEVSLPLWINEKPTAVSGTGPARVCTQKRKNWPPLLAQEMGQTATMTVAHLKDASETMR